MRSANSVAERKRDTTTMAEGQDQISTGCKDGINVGMSAEESIEETGNEEGIASDQRIEKDTVPQEEEREQSCETHSDTGMCTYTTHDCSLSSSCGTVSFSIL